MEKGFNDDELADIMSEIESLEQEFEQDGNGAAQQVEATASEPIEPEQEEEAAPVASQQESEEEPAQVASQQESEEEADEAFSNEEMNEVLNELSNMPVEEIAPIKHKQPQHDEDANIHHFKAPVHAPKSHKAGHSSMNFHVAGNMTVDLSFNVGGNEVAICVNEQEGLVITLQGGAKFTLPICHHSEKKAS